MLHGLNNHSASLSSLQVKLAFLLGVTCFFRPSDLHRIPLTSVILSADGSLLSLEVHSPKEKRGRRRIIKCFAIKAHVDSCLCPVATYVAFRAKQPCCAVSSLFVNSLHPDSPLSVRTFQRWLRRLLYLSTSEPRASIRSIASALDLRAGIPKDDIVTIGNWASSTTFENFYRREHQSLFDFAKNPPYY